VRRVVASLIVTSVAASLAAQVPAPEPTLPAVLQRTAEYVAAYQMKLAGIVAEEHYRQSVVRIFAAPNQRVTPVPQNRELKSDLLMVRAEGEDRWVQFRDVFEVDAKPIRDRDQRLFKLFIEPTSGSRRQAEAIATESARFNIGPLLRTINVPILALIFFESGNQPRFVHHRAKAGDLRDMLGQASENDILAIDYRETASRTLIRGADDRNIRSSGRVWVDGTNGRVLKTQLKSGYADVRAEITVTYKAEPGLDLLVPGEMKEAYMLPRSMTRIEGTATYRRFRQFTVVTTERTKQQRESDDLAR
jgi:hypothetical protein